MVHYDARIHLPQCVLYKDVQINVTLMVYVLEDVVFVIRVIKVLLARSYHLLVLRVRLIYICYRRIIIVLLAVIGPSLGIVYLVVKGVCLVIRRVVYFV